MRRCIKTKREPKEHNAQMYRDKERTERTQCAGEKRQRENQKNTMCRYIETKREQKEHNVQVYRDKERTKKHNVQVYRDKDRTKRVTMCR